MSLKRQAPAVFIPERPKSPRLTFDLVMVDDLFPAVKTQTEQAARLASAILKRNTDLTPSLEEQSHITALVSQIQIVLETMSLDVDSASEFAVEEFRVVGSFKKGTMIRGKNEADIVLILRYSPTTDVISHLVDRISSELKITNPGPEIDFNVTEYGFLVSNRETKASVRMLLTTHSATKKTDIRPHVAANLMTRHLAAIRHVRWFEDSANSAVYKALIRVVKDIVDRYTGLQVMNRWAIDVLSHYSISFTRTEQPLPLYHALKRFFQLLSGGMFLPGSAGIPDPCDNGVTTLHSCMTQKQQDRLCMSAQTVTRILSTGSGFETILGLVSDEVSVLENESQWDGVLIQPHGMVIGSEDHENKTQVPEYMDGSYTESMNEHADDNSDSLTFFSD